MAEVDLNALIGAAVGRHLPMAVASRHHLHRNPELSGDERETARFVSDQLATLGLDDVQTGVGGYGVVATIKGPLPGPVVALRADMDALPIREQSDVPYKSCRSGVMHACGHDGHTANLLGVAAVTAELRQHLRGELRLLFQPAEETVGGAEGMCNAGAVDGVDAIFALHGWPELEVGQVGYLPGPMMASADRFDLSIHGKGGHAGYPHTVVDPIVTSAHVVQALQTIASREVSPLDSVVVSVTKINAGTAYNVIPDCVDLGGTVRCLLDETRQEAPGRIERVVAGVCEALRCMYELKYEMGCPVVVNDLALTEFVRQTAVNALGEPCVVRLSSPTMGGEDFAHYQKLVPGVIFRLGVGKYTSALHTPTYDFGDGPLENGMRVLAHLALAYAGHVAES
jgi:amidohydrolase